MATLHIQKRTDVYETNLYTYILKTKYNQLKGKFTYNRNLYQDPCIIVLDKNMDFNSILSEINLRDSYVVDPSIHISAVDLKSKFAILVRMGGGTMQLDTGAILAAVEKHDDNDVKIPAEANLNIAFVRKLINMLVLFRGQDYNLWIRVIQALACMGEDYKGISMEFNLKNTEKYDHEKLWVLFKNDKKYNHIEALAMIQFWAKKDNIIQYNICKSKFDEQSFVTVEKHDNDEGKNNKEADVSEVALDFDNIIPFRHLVKKTTLECVRLLRICPDLNEDKLYKILKLEDEMENLVFATSCYMIAVQVLEKEKFNKCTMTFEISTAYLLSDMKLYFVSGYKNSEEMFKLEVGIKRYDDMYHKYGDHIFVKVNNGNVNVGGYNIKMTINEHTEFVKTIRKALRS